MIHCRFAVAMLRSFPMSGRVTVIAVPLAMLFTMANEQATMMPAVFRVDICGLPIVESIAAL